MKIKHFLYELDSRDNTKITGDFSYHENSKKEKVFVIFPGMTAMTEQYTYVRFRDLMF